MNIKEACDRVARLQSEIKSATDLIFMTNREAGRGEFPLGEISIAAARYENQRISVSVKSFLDLLELRAKEAQAQIDNLQPVIDMANAALRGIEK